MDQLQHERDDAVAHAERFQSELANANLALETLRRDFQATSTDLQATVARLAASEAAVAVNQTMTAQAQTDRDHFVAEESERRSELVEKTRADATIIELATAQNTELKTRLFELEDRFVVISNERMALTNQVDALKHQLQRPAGPPSPRGLPGTAPEPADVDASPTPPAKSSTPSSARGTGPLGQELIDTLYLQIRQLEMERHELLSQSQQHSASGTPPGASRRPSTTEAGTNLPEMPDGTAPSELAKTEVRVAKLQLELAAAEVEITALHSRLAHVNDLNADLSQRLRKEEELTTQLAKETEKIPELIIIYQQQRAALQTKMQEQEELLRQSFGRPSLAANGAAVRNINGRWQCARVISASLACVVSPPSPLSPIQAPRWQDSELPPWRLTRPRTLPKFASRHPSLLSAQRIQASRLRTSGERMPCTLTLRKCNACRRKRSSSPTNIVRLWETLGRNTREFLCCRASQSRTRTLVIKPGPRGEEHSTDQTRERAHDVYATF